MAAPSSTARALLDAYFGGAAGAVAGAGTCAGAGPRGSEVRGPGARGPVPLWPFQAEGLARLRRIVQARAGAILADSVGLGKTHVALALVAEHLDGGGECVIVVPASLRPFWRRKVRLLAPHRPRLLSHTQLARGATVASPSGPRLVVVDEAHRFRNPRTLRYAALSRLTGPEARVLLVTATPVNNGLRDLLHLVRLFAPDHAFRDLGVASLEGAFESADAVDRRRAAEAAGPAEAGGRGPAEIDSPLTRIVRAVVVRRTRAMIRARFGDAGTFPDRAAPRIVAYEDPLVAPRVRCVEGLELPLHGAGADGGAAALVRLGLLKRLDSSRHAFERSVARLRSQTRVALDAVEKGRLPDLVTGRSDGRAEVDPLQLLLVEVVSGPAPPGADLTGLARSLARDLEGIDRLSGRAGRGRRTGTWPDQGRPTGSRRSSGVEGGQPDGRSADPKLTALVGLLERTRGERTLVFTEYRDTARAVWSGLAGRFQVGRVDGSGAWLGQRAAGRRVVVERFAPRANGRRRFPSHERVEVLVTTDVLAEGINLQDARHIVSYDLPWNPVRLLQRIGRIDRAGSPHAEIVPLLFVPAAGLDEALGLVRRLRSKLASITGTVGAEHADAILDELIGWDADRGVAGQDAPSPGLGRVLARIEAEEGEGDPVERLRTLWIRHRNTAPGTSRQRAPIPASTPVVAAIPVQPTSHSAQLEWVVGIRAAAGPRHRSSGSNGHGSREAVGRGSALLLEIDRNGRASRAGSRAVRAFEAAFSRDNAQPAGHRTDPLDDVPWQSILDFVRRDAANARTPAPLAARDPAARLAGRIRQALALAPGRDRALMADADRLLAALATPLPPPMLGRLRDMMEAWDRAMEPGQGEAEARRLIVAVRAILVDGAAAVHPGPTAASGHEAGIELVGGLRIVVDAS